MRTLIDEILERSPSDAYFRKSISPFHTEISDCLNCFPMNEHAIAYQFEGEGNNWFDVNKAKRLNYCMKNWLGWGGTAAEKRNFENKIKLLLENEGYYDPFPYAEDPQGDFALAVREWQLSNRLTPDGVIGPATWDSFGNILGLPFKPTPELPSWIEKPIPQSPYFSDRRGMDITHLIYHATTGGSLEGAVSRFQRNSDKVSAHYIIGKEGRIVQMVSPNKAAQHAGQNRNRYSIGIEIVNYGFLLNKGHRNKKGTKTCNYTYCTPYFDKYDGTPADTLPSYFRKSDSKWDPYIEQQYRSLVKLTIYLLACIPTIKYVMGHEHIVLPSLRADPGGAFDWLRVKKDLKSTWHQEIGTAFPALICDKSAVNAKTGKVPVDESGRIMPNCI